MEKLSRRKLIAQASAGAGVAGLLVAAGAYASDKAQGVKAAGEMAAVKTSPMDASAVNIVDEPLAVFVTDPVRGTLVVMHGDREITLDHPVLAQSLLALM